MVNLSSSFGNLWILWSTLSTKRRRQIVFLQVLSLLGAAGEALNLGALLPFLNILAEPKSTDFGNGFWTKYLALIPEGNIPFSLGGLFIITVSLTTIIRIFTIRLQWRLGAGVTTEISRRIFNSVLLKPYSWHTDNNSVRLMSMLTKDVDQANSSIQALLILIVNLAIVLFLVGGLLVLYPGTMLITSLTMGSFYITVYGYNRKSLRNEGKALTENHQQGLKVAQEALGGIREVILERNQEYFSDIFKEKTERYRLAIANISMKAQTPRYFVEGFAIIFLIVLSLLLKMQGNDVKDLIPLLGILSLGMYRLLQPLQQCFASASILMGNQASLKRLHTFLEDGGEENVIENRKLCCTSEEKLESIELSNVSFRYSDFTPWVLRNVSLSIKKGEKVAFVGSTGCGKSTIIDILLGLLIPERGFVRLNGQRMYSQSGYEYDCSWSGLVSHVPQDIYLTDGSFEQNIAFGSPSEMIDRRKVYEAARKACICSFIQSTPDGFKTLVGERGVKLSGGQCQRIGLARAFYKNYQMLILDEATSALDNCTEKEVMRQVELHGNESAIVIIAHRLTTIKGCDRIYVIKDGEIDAVGSYDKLLSTSKEFRKFVYKQETL